MVSDIKLEEKKVRIEADSDIWLDATVVRIGKDLGYSPVFKGLFIDSNANANIECLAKSVNLLDPDPNLGEEEPVRVALLHSDQDELVINQDQNYKGGVRIEGATNLKMGDFLINSGEFQIGSSTGGNPAPTAKGLKIRNSNSDCGLILTEKRAILKAIPNTLPFSPVYMDLYQSIADLQNGNFNSGITIGDFHISFGEFQIGFAKGGKPAPTAKGLKIRNSKSDCGLILTEKKVILDTLSSPKPNVTDTRSYTDLYQTISDLEKRIAVLEGEK